MPTRSQSGRKTVMACLLKNEPTSLCTRRKISPLSDESVGKPSVNSANIVEVRSQAKRYFGIFESGLQLLLLVVSIRPEAR